MISIEEVRIFILDKLKGAPAGVVGSSLALLVRRQFPDFDFRTTGQRTFKEFIQVLVPECRIVDRSGMDVIYGLSGASEVVEQYQQTDIHPCYWADWTSPASRSRIYIGASGTVSPTMGSAEDKLLAPLSPEGHKSIARAFLDTPDFPEELKRSLIDSLGEPTEGWWISWLTVIRQNKYMYKRWLGFRLAQLRDRLQEELSSLGLGEVETNNAYNLIFATRRPRPKRDRSTEKNPIPMGKQTIKDFAKSIIDLMPDSEIEKLVLPFKYLFESVHKGYRN